MTEENWDNELTSTSFGAPTTSILKSKVDENNNWGFGSFSSKFSSDLKDDDTENKGGFGGFGAFRNKESDTGSFGFNKNEDDQTGGNGRKFGQGRFGGFGKTNDESDGDERKSYGRGRPGFRRENEGGFGNDRKRENTNGSFGFRKNDGAFGNNRDWDNNDRARNGRSFGNNRSFSDRNSEERSSGFGKNSFSSERDNKETGEGFGRRAFDASDRKGESSNEGGFGRRNFGDKSRDRNFSGRSRSGFGDRSRDNDDGDSGSRFRKERRDENGGGFKSFGARREKSEGGFDRRKNFDDSFRGENAEKKENEKERERYIPQEVEDTEENLFHNVIIGENFNKQNEIPATITGSGSESINPILKFEDANLSDLLLSNLKKCNYETPTPVQKYAIPIITQKRDLMACAQTGSGKTAAFILPIMTNILNDGIESSSLMSVQEPQALILTPTRELALQTYNECKKFSYGSIIKSGILYGGVDTMFQLRNLSKGCNILIATPGRLLDVIDKGKVSLQKVKYFVLDEADRMLDMGFEQAVRDVLTKGLVKQKGDRCTFMFSATFPKEIQQLAQDFLNDYLFLTIGVVGGANTDVEQIIYKVKKFDKREKCVELLNDIGNDKTMIFLDQKKQADVFAFYLIQRGYKSTSIHGDRLQSQREAALNDFKSGKAKIIVCTSVAARGLDIEKVQHVINFDLPNTIDEYVHRIGRTGRCGNPGKAISFYDPDNANDRALARSIVRILTTAQQKVPDWLTEEAENSGSSLLTFNSETDDMRDKLNNMNITSPGSLFQSQEESWDT